MLSYQACDIAFCLLVATVCSLMPLLLAFHAWQAPLLSKHIDGFMFL